MQTSEHLIAYQTVSSAAYRRLRETLTQQEYVFERVVTEATDSHFVPIRPISAEPTSLNGAKASSDREGLGMENLGQEELGAEDFVLMCSPRLNVLLTATPILSQGSSARRDRSAEYRVGLTFDDRAIAVFINRLKNRPHRANPVLSNPVFSKPALFNPIYAGQRDCPPMPKQKAHESFDHESFDQPSNISDSDKLIAQKAFVLSWAKNLATSPEGDPQPTQESLDNHIQQNLLLDQVITRIRHSLDLSAILETTVAQVREFLCADRLVLYQFDHFAASEESRSEPLRSEAVQPNPRGSILDNPLDNPLGNLLGNPSVNLSGNLSGNPSENPSPKAVLIGQRSHTGHVTYESRSSEDIASVLHLSEGECFESCLPMRSRYLESQSIPIDNVEVQYAQTPCLLNFLQEAGIKSKMIAPIFVQDQLWGLLIVHQCQRYRHWEKTEAVFLQHIAEHLAVAISQASLYQQLRQQTVSLESCVIERTRNLHDALMAAESANITKGEFLSTMSHELRTPLTYIIGMSATLLRWSFGELNEHQRSYLNTIHQSGEQLLDVINNILEFASVESGRSLLDYDELSLEQLIKTVVSHHQEMAKKQNIELTLDLKVSPDQDRFIADAKRLQKILSNLVHNAIKFTGANGQVNVRVWRDSCGTVFQIKDTGIGIPESQKDVLFETFKQLEAPIQRQYPGTGLGLAMTKRLVELHGGSIQVDSQVGKGSTFTVRLPVQSELTPPQPYNLTVSDETTNRVILLETDEANAAIVCEMLTAAGYEVIWLIESNSLAAQLELLRPVLLIADLSLIKADISTIKAIQLAITAINAKVLALATHSDSAPSPMAHHDTLRKPIDPKVLLEKVRQLMIATAER